MMNNPEPTAFHLPEAWEPTAVDALIEAGEYLAAGFLACDGNVTERMARGWRMQIEHCELPAWHGEALYPAGRRSYFSQGSAIQFHYSSSMTVNRSTLNKRAEESAVYAALRDSLGVYPVPSAAIDSDLTLGGANYTHSIINYGRVLRKGLVRYEERVQAGLAQAEADGDSEAGAFYRAMADTLEGIRVMHARTLAYLEGLNPRDPSDRASLARLVNALRKVPWQPAETFYEGLVATNWLYYLDGCDNLGRLDQDLGVLYERDLAAGLLSEDQGTELMSLMWSNVDANDGWNTAIGGSDINGRSAANALTLACLRAVPGHRRPNLALRVTHDAPAEVLEAALDAIASGSGIPALYNEAAYYRAVEAAGLGIRPEDLPSLAFGGCTETMVHGCSNVGSLDAGLNLPLILSQTLESHLSTATSYSELEDAFQADMAAAVARMASGVSRAQELHAEWQPNPLRSLLIDDCLEVAREFNAGGARYNWSVVNVGGLATVTDSLAAIRELVFESGYITAPELWRALQANFEGYGELALRIALCPRYGNDQPAADEIAVRLTEGLFGEFKRYTPWRGGRFLPSCLLFVTYTDAGARVMATPDGRRAGEAIADSIGPVAGRDRHGPTAMLRSVASIPQEQAAGTLVMNMRVNKGMFVGENRERMLDLMRSYFAMGGMQMQITVVDQETLRAALAEPEKYGDLIVRVGGYSEYWRNLTDALRRTVLECTEYLV